MTNKEKVEILERENAKLQKELEMYKGYNMDVLSKEYMKQINELKKCKERYEKLIKKLKTMKKYFK